MTDGWGVLGFILSALASAVGSLALYILACLRRDVAELYKKQQKDVERLLEIRDCDRREVEDYFRRVAENIGRLQGRINSR